MGEPIYDNEVWEQNVLAQSKFLILSNLLKKEPQNLKVSYRTKMLDQVITYPGVGNSVLK